MFYCIMPCICFYPTYHLALTEAVILIFSVFVNIIIITRLYTIITISIFSFLNTVTTLLYYHDYSTDCLHCLIFIQAYLPSIARLLVGEALVVVDFFPFPLVSIISYIALYLLKLQSEELIRKLPQYKRGVAAVNKLFSLAETETGNPW